VDERGIIRLAMKGWPSPDAVYQAVERCNQTGFKGAGRRGRRRVPEVSGVGLRRLQGDEPGTVVLDVRTEADWRIGHVPGAINVPIDELEARQGGLPPKTTPIVVVCDQGLRAPAAAWQLKALGWRQLYTLVDGMAAWKGDLEAAPIQ
jgi:rhodanese-related sulfurtransferase